MISRLCNRPGRSLASLVNLDGEYCKLTVLPSVLRAGREVLSVLAEVQIEDPSAVALQGGQQPRVRERVLGRSNLPPTTGLATSLRGRHLGRGVKITTFVETERFLPAGMKHYAGQ